MEALEEIHGEIFLKRCVPGKQHTIGLIVGRKKDCGILFLTYEGKLIRNRDSQVTLVLNYRAWIGEEHPLKGGFYD